MVDVLVVAVKDSESVVVGTEVFSDGESSELAHS